MPAKKQSISSPPSKDAASVPTFADVARLVAGSDIQPWLSKHLERWGTSLRMDRFASERQSTKVVMKQRLAEIRDAAVLLGKALSDAATREFLEGAGLIRIENLGGLERTLRIIAERAELAAASPAISTEAGKTKAGRGKASAPGAFSPKTYCALLIAETWVHFHKRYPGPRNPKAAAAVDAYWRASGGEVTGSGNALNGWRYYFTKAQATTAAELRAEYRRHLVEAAHWG